MLLIAPGSVKIFIVFFLFQGHEYKRSFFNGTGRGTGFSEGTRNAFFLRKFGAGDGIRTRNPQLGKLMRYRCATPAQEGEKKIIKVLRRVNTDQICPAALNFEN